MYIVEEVELVTFYSQYLEAVRKRGFKLLILALVRDADAPDFYSDVKRYWSSLNDVTGRYALFALAGNEASEAFHTTATAIEGPRTGFSSYLAAPSGQDFAQLDEQAQALRRTGRLPTSLIGSRRLEEANTSQVSALCRYLGVPEKEVPCLYLTLITPTGVECRTLAISSFGDFSIYVACKNIIERLQPCFDAWEQAGDRMSELRQEKRELDLQQKAACLAKRSSANRRDRRTAGALRDASELREGLDQAKRLSLSCSPSTKQLFQQVISACENSARQHVQKVVLFHAIHAAERNSLGKHESKLLRHLVARAFSSRLLESELKDLAEDEGDTDREAALESLLGRREAIDVQLLDRQGEISSAVSQMESKFRSIGTDWRRSTSEVRWNAFVSYPKADKAIALRIFESLSKIGEKVFLDETCLAPGEDWPLKIAAAQANSDTTVAVITRNTPQAHYQNSEFLRAIDHYRRGKTHRIIPVYTSRDLVPPVGLEQMHGIFPGQDGDVIPPLLMALSPAGVGLT